MSSQAKPCGCNYSGCPDWHVYPQAAVQGVSFTEEEAKIVAAILSGTAVFILCEDAEDAKVTAEAVNYATPHVGTATTLTKETSA
jgi:hypothetical protein